MPIYNHLREFLSLLLVVLLAVSPLEARTKKGEKLLKDGNLLEGRKEWDKALEVYEQALATDPADQAYQLSVRRARFQASQGHVDKGQNLRKEGKLEEALAEFQKAFTLDASSTIAEQELRRTYEMIQREKRKKEGGEESTPEERGLTPAQQARAEMERRTASVLGVPELKPTGRITNLKMNNQAVRILFETVGKLAGVTALFDSDFLQQSSGKNYSLDLPNATVEEALDHLSVLTKAYWKPLSSNSIFVTQDNVTKRRDYEEQVVKTFYLQNVTSAQELQEIATIIRSVTDIRRLITYNGQMAMTARGSVDQVNLAQKIILDLDKPKSEVVIDIIVLEANRTKTRSLAAAIAAAGQAGINTAIGFTPRNPVLLGGNNNNTNNTNTTNNNTNANNNALGALLGLGGLGTGLGTGFSTTGAAQAQLISLARIGKLSTNDFSVTMPGALLQAVLNDRQTRVLQNPQVRTLDTLKVTLKIGDKYPYASGSFSGAGGLGGVGVSPLVNTQFQFADVGVNVDILPKIHGSEEVTMHVEVEVSNIRDNINVGGLTQPVIGQRRISEDVRLREGEVSLLGGLTTIQGTRGVQGIPGLSNIPGFGRLFSSENTDNSRSELLIAIIPRIVRGPEISDINMRGIAAGNDQTVKLNYAPREEKKEEKKESTRPAGAPAPTSIPSTPAPPFTAPQQPPNSQQPNRPGPNSPAAMIPGLFRPATTGPQLNLALTNPDVRVSGLVAVTLDMAGAADLMSAAMRAKYDDKVLKLVSIARGGLMAQDGQSVDFTQDSNKGEFKVNRLAGAPGVTGAGTLVTLTFIALQKGATEIGLEEVQLENSQRQPVQASVRSVNVTVQ
jgi:general secretion pathway protein D